MTRRITLIIAAFIVVCSAASAGELKGKIELSTAVSAQILAGNGQIDYIINIPVRVGGFVSEEFLIEGETILTLPEDEDASYVLSALASYHIPTLGKVKPFFLGGIGFSNSFHLAGLLTIGDLGETATVLNGGVGFKSFFSEGAALRVEYRYQRFIFDREAITSHMLLTGVSLML